MSQFLSLPQIYYTTDIGVSEFGFVINIIMVVVVSLHLALETLHWVIQRRIEPANHSYTILYWVIQGRIEPANNSYTIRVGFANTKVPYKWGLSTMKSFEMVDGQKYFLQPTCLQISTYISYCTGLALFPGLPAVQFWVAYWK